jgi:hypothetical protein
MLGEVGGILGGIVGEVHGCYRINNNSKRQEFFVNLDEDGTIGQNTAF